MALVSLALVLAAATGGPGYPRMCRLGDSARRQLVYLDPHPTSRHPTPAGRGQGFEQPEALPCYGTRIAGHTAGARRKHLEVMNDLPSWRPIAHRAPDRPILLPPGKVLGRLDLRPLLRNSTD